ncbi:MAG: hypothetical protein E5X23_13970 [Mesorhizobium sp.]|nr:hypothetical protein EJ078_06270 [Mesorhizobium sp. M1A.F.Ca.IN.022.06.1.1]RUU96956.1 hypothetical protein EOA79_25680 [Mesorhizobium sp. M1A.F.Ca.IN.020.03.2.1]RUV26145.1 hypothetical protein EOA91_05840 [Mesorhizobium sp. M1A.F.Ca.IN.022.04.1.1]RUV58560.1 hypothetical protein EOA64_23350 [Mesorhizobium sp. M1A.F.Ca.IN.022.02.1.1]RUV89046.1 hypothetical protein EOA51_04855 [Mesorhizobium sp. M1A.F.Ca.IN.020.32.1.1]RUW07722.1 hypothetical protein EOA46_22880 [Mesorhizobium sp. M1A.F.Ca.IN.0
MGATMQGLKRSCWKEDYDLDEFAGRHGLTIRQAEIVIQSNGPSKHKCDLAAAAFKVALEQCRHLREKRREAPGHVREPSGDLN